MTRSELPSETGAYPLLTLMREASQSLGVDVRSADVDIEAGSSGLGVALRAALLWFIGRRRPLIIVGLLSQEEVIRASGNGALRPFLEGQRVRYLQMPIELAALKAAAHALGDAPVSGEEVERLGETVVQIHLDDDLYRDVIHRIDSGSGALFKQWVDGLRESADNDSACGAAGPAAREPADFHDSLVRALESLKKLITELSEYGFKRAAPPVLSKLRTQAENLRRAEELARRLVDFEMGERSPGAGPRSMDEAARLGREILTIKSDSLKVLKPLCHRRRG